MMEIKLNLTPLSDWLPRKDSPLIIAGPCSAETEEQVMKTARALAEISHVRIFRAGIWKPRTRPNTFEGVGPIGFEWLKRVKEETGLLVTVEVATPEHAELALKNNVDILWLGARTTANPFSVQEIADVIRGSDIPVMVKNPVNPDLQLWIGALERINQAGITKLIAVHRGFSSYKKTKYRNAPNWKLATDLMSLIPDLPIICDPSHIAGDTQLLFPVAQRALHLEMDGLMIETHIHPKAALSDAAQQVTPEQLTILLDQLFAGTKTVQDKELQEVLESLRKQIDQIDQELLETVSERFEMVRQIGKCKKEKNASVVHMNRWTKLLQDRVTEGEKLNLKQQFVQSLFQLIHNESIKTQLRIVNE